MRPAPLLNNSTRRVLTVRGGRANSFRGTETDGVLLWRSPPSRRREILGQYGLHDTDTGSPEAQVAMLTKRISDLTEHLRSISMITTPVVACCCWSAAVVGCSRARGPGRRRALPFADRAPGPAPLSAAGGCPGDRCVAGPLCPRCNMRTFARRLVRLEHPRCGPRTSARVVPASQRGSPIGRSSVVAAGLEIPLTRPLRSTAVAVR